MWRKFHTKAAPATIVRHASGRWALALAVIASPLCRRRGIMRALVITIAAFSLASSAAAQQQPVAPAATTTPPPVASISPQVQRTIDQLREAGLNDDRGYEIVRDLVTQVGPRISGSDQEARARDWAAAML